MAYGKKYMYPRRKTGSRPTNRKLATGKAKRQIAAIAKKVTLKLSEPKVARQIYSSLTDPGHLSLYHNVPHFINNLLETQQGVHANPGANVVDNRIGEEVIATGLKLKMQLINRPTESNVTYKYFVYQYQSNDPPGTATAFFVGPGGAGGNMNRMLDFVDTRKVTILSTGYVKTNHMTANMNQSCQYTNSEHPYILGRALDGSQPMMHTTYKEIWIPMNHKKIRYESNNSPTPKFKDIGVCMLAYDVNNTAQSQVLGYWDMTSSFYFRDP